MAEYKDVHSSCPARVLKLQLNAEQPLRGECWIPPKKIPHVQRQRRSPKKMLGRAKSRLVSNPIPARDLKDSNEILGVPGQETSQETEPHLPLSVWVLSAEAQVSRGHHRDKRSGCNSPRRHCVWHKSSWRRSTLPSPESHQANDPQTGEQLYQRCSSTVAKVLGSTTDSLTSRCGKRTDNPHGIWLWRPWILIAELPQDWGNRLLEGTNKISCAPGPKKKEQDPTREKTRLACECPGVSGRGLG